MQYCLHLRLPSGATASTHGRQALPAHLVSQSSPYGCTQVSDHARQAVLLSLSPRFCGNGWPTATRSLRVTCARRAGIKQLYTPCGRPATLPAATVSMNGSPKSYHVKAMRSSSDSMVSVQNV